MSDQDEVAAMLAQAEHFFRAACDGLIAVQETLRNELEDPPSDRLARQYRTLDRQVGGVLHSAGSQFINWAPAAAQEDAPFASQTMSEASLHYTPLISNGAEAISSADKMLRVVAMPLRRSKDGILPQVYRALRQAKTNFEQTRRILDTLFSLLNPNEATSASAAAQEHAPPMHQPSVPDTAKREAKPGKPTDPLWWQPVADWFSKYFRWPFG